MKAFYHRFAVEQLVNEQISHHYEFALLALARVPCTSMESRGLQLKVGRRCRVNLEPMALFRTDSDHVELDKVPNHGKHPKDFCILEFSI